MALVSVVYIIGSNVENFIPMLHISFDYLIQCTDLELANLWATTFGRVGVAIVACQDTNQAFLIGSQSAEHAHYIHAGRTRFFYTIANELALREYHSIVGTYDIQNARDIRHPILMNIYKNACLDNFRAVDDEMVSRGLTPLLNIAQQLAAQAFRGQTP